jgi:hypothetical protein
MTNYIENEMTMSNGSMNTYMESSGISDISLTSLHNISEKAYVPGQTILQVGVSLPTGSITEEDSGTRLPYKMQLGSGTIDPVLQVTNRRYIGEYILGTQISAVVRFGDNDEGYRLGNEYKASLWIDRNFNDYLSTSIRLSALSEGQISGSDSAIENTTTSLRDAQLQNGDLVDIAIGVNYIIDQISGLRLAVEYNLPIYQNLNGPSLGVSDSFIIGVQYTIGY